MSHPDMVELAKTCPNHVDHKAVAGTCRDGENLSVKTSRYTAEFCEAWLSCIRKEHQLCHFACLEEMSDLGSEVSDSRCVPACPGFEVIAADQDPPTDDQALIQLRKVHNNLGHPANRELVRVLKNAGGSDQAVRLASEFKCGVCHNRQRPAPSLPTSAHQIVDFNH